MSILQAEVPKSGNYWLYSIIRKILQAAGEQHDSYIQQHSIQSEVDRWEFSFARQSQMDFLNIERGRCYCRISEVFKEEIAILDRDLNSVLTYSHAREQRKRLSINK